MRIKILITIAVLFALAIPSVAEAKPILLLFHAGGFCFGSPAQIDSAATYARPQFRPHNIDYPRCTPDLGAAMRYSVAQAKRFPNRRVYAYGESAGGSIAARLADFQRRS